MRVQQIQEKATGSPVCYLENMVYPLFLRGATGVGWVDLFKKACIVDGNEPFRQNGFIFFPKWKFKKKCLKKTTTQITIYIDPPMEGWGSKPSWSFEKICQRQIGSFLFRGRGEHQKIIELPPPRTPRIQSPSQMMIGVYNHLLRKVFRFHETILSFGEPGSLGENVWPTIFDPTTHHLSIHLSPPHWLRSAPSRSEHLTWLADVAGCGYRISAGWG